MILVKPDTKFDQETLKIGFTPRYYDDTALNGTTVIEAFTLKNDGSYKEDEEFKIDTNMLILLIVILVILIILALIIKRKKA